MSSASSRGGGVKNIQRGVFSHSGSGAEESVTVTSVVTGKTSLTVIGETHNATWRGRLVNATTVGFTSNIATSFSWELIERY